MCFQAASFALLLDETPVTLPKHCFARRSHSIDLRGRGRRQHGDHDRRICGQVPGVLLWRNRHRYCEPQRIHEEPHCHCARDDRNRQNPGTLHRDRDEHPALAHQPHTLLHTLHAALRGLCTTNRPGQYALPLSEEMAVSSQTKWTAHRTRSEINQENCFKKLRVS
ncbi:uncharacterized protein LOC142761650 isoform X1 [Rhipicephalus microplus]|uniref:uncharacterized protein LOC142761650 isoform X1 n=1 Tax=Rhipicephalus microplus TaxID=6941 RepID=UPI003F6D6FB2